ncbi:MAG: phosphotransferase [bacterium]
MKEVSQKLRKKMDQLLDDKFIKNFFDGNLKAFFDNAESIKSIKRITHKEVRGNFDYSLIIEFILEINYKNNQTITKSIFCKAHSDEKKNKSTYYMEMLYKNGFNEGLYQVPRPLSYIPMLRAGFYEGAQGHNLLYYLKQRDFDKIENIVKNAAHWISKLHELKFNDFNSLKISIAKIKDNKPPIKQVFKDMKKHYLRLYDEFAPLYRATRKYETMFLKELKREEKTKIIYADYHPENIIAQSHSQDGISVIDFTDLALGDPYRDVGTFMEQVDFMSKKYMPPEKARQWRTIFLEEYIKTNNIKLTKREFQRINLYCLWTSLRNIIYFYYKKDQNQVIPKLIADAKIYLDKVKHKSTEI